MMRENTSSKGAFSFLTWLLFACALVVTIFTFQTYFRRVPNKSGRFNAAVFILSFANVSDFTANGVAQSINCSPLACHSETPIASGRAGYAAIPVLHASSGCLRLGECCGQSDSDDDNCFHGALLLVAV